ncbi:MAG: hypothetical protein Q7T33_06085 [Dehalococcoidia bacterium]|nr:hypothetical protein [Dehalococcoidia bacterium]
MAGPGCGEAVELLNVVFTTALILNDGHEILARLNAGDEVADVVEDLATKFGKPSMTGEIRKVTAGWPPLHLEAVGEMVKWALGKLDTEERVTISWKGDADSPETVTRFELSGRSLQIEFAHPPASF